MSRFDLNLVGFKEKVMLCLFLIFSCRDLVETKEADSEEDQAQLLKDQLVKANNLVDVLKKESSQTYSNKGMYNPIIQLHWNKNIIVSLLQRPIEITFSQVCYFVQMFRYTKWENWSLTITKGVQGWIQKGSPNLGLVLGNVKR